MVLAPSAQKAPVRVELSADAWALRGLGIPLERVAVPAVMLGEGEVLVEVELASICGSDLRTVAGLKHRNLPIVLGHEQVGRVIRLGPGSPARDVAGRILAVGARVTWAVTRSCTRCRRCRAGLPQDCARVLRYGHERMRRGWELSGSFASHVHLLAGTAIVPVSEVIPAAVIAPVSCAIATAAAVVSAAGDIEGSTVLVMGAGMRGLAASAMAKEAGARVIVADVDVNRRALAERFGASILTDPAKLGALTRRPDVTFELSGAPAAVHQAIDATDAGGAVVLAGTLSPGQALRVDPMQLVNRSLTLHGVHRYAPANLLRGVAFLESVWRDYPFEQLMGEVLPMDRLDTALRFAADRRSARVGVTPQMQ